MLPAIIISNCNREGFTVAFEVYMPRKKGTRQGRARKPAIRLSKSSLVLNKLAREALGADNVELAFDPETAMVRIAPGGVIKVSKTKIFAKGFRRHFGISANGKFDAEMVDGALVAKIS